MTNSLPIKEVLCSCGLFAGCEEKTLQLAADSAQLKSFEPGAEVMLIGGGGRCLAVLAEGACDVKKHTSDGRQVVMSRLLPGDMFGAATLFDKGGGPLTSVTAATRCSAVFMGSGPVRELLSKDPAFLENYLSYLCGRIRFLNRRIEAFTGGSAEQRLYNWIKSAETDGFSPPVSMTKLAAALDIGRASLYRAVESLVRQGYIERYGKRFQILKEFKGEPQ